MALLLTTAATKLRWKLFNNIGGDVQESPFALSNVFTESKRRRRRSRFVSLAVNSGGSAEVKQGATVSIAPVRSRGRELVLSEGRDEDENYGLVCPGCGVFMQDKDPNLPGFYKERKIRTGSDGLLEDETGIVEDEFEGSVDGLEGEAEKFESVNYEERDSVEESDLVKSDGRDLDFQPAEATLEQLEDEEYDLDVNGFAPAGVGYGNITEEVAERKRRDREKKMTKAEKKRMAREAKKEKDEVRVCARCHSLRYYGQVKYQTAENLIPDFDFDRLIGTRLIKPSGNGNATVIVLVVDCVDFDGSFPKRAVKSLFDAMVVAKDDPKASKKLPKLVLVATKVDLLPSQVSPARLDRWVRRRARAGGAPKLSGVYIVSARKDLGVRNLLSFIKESAGPRGNVWVIGAQNAGKSTLINALAKKEGAKITRLTEAPVAGTTLGILRIGGILPAKAKMYDTPGLLHPYLMFTRLNRDEQRMVEVRKELKPRTYRIKAGQAVHVGGLLRLDLEQASVDTIYVTVWASPHIPLHMGKIENADDLRINHVGVRLQPPVGEDRASELGRWEAKEIKVTGTSWDVNSMDISVAGLGWLSFGLKGEATLKLWTYDGIEVTSREALVLDRASFLERPGFLLTKSISDVIGNQNKSKTKRRNSSTDDILVDHSEVSA